MNAVDKTIWYIENHYRQQISLDTLAGVSGVSKYHLSRIFCYAIGLSISRYVRLRRLSQAAAALAAGEEDILDLALSLGYGSHEAFSRAFKERFGLTPEKVRQQGHTNNLELQEAVQMHQSKIMDLDEPRFEQAPATTLVGLSRCYSFERMADIPDQWQTFASLIPQVSSESKPVTYGVIYNSGDENFDYLSAIELPAGARAPGNMVRLDLLAQTYAVFQHTGHVATVRETCHAIWADWLPRSGRQMLQMPWFERYGESFDPQSGAGGLEVWIPIVA